jgi:hypothetical protein
MYLMMPTARQAYHAVEAQRAAGARDNQVGCHFDPVLGICPDGADVRTLLINRCTLPIAA